MDSSDSTSAGTSEPEHAIPVFDLQAICVEFDGVHVLDHLNLQIEAGTFVALLGPNGSGKSTLIRAMLGLQPLAHGHLRIYGKTLASFQQWHRIGFVPQRLPAATGVPVSVREMVASARTGPHTRWRRRSRTAVAACEEALDRVGLAHRRRDRFDTLSGGQQRRVMVARALAGGATVLVLDEPTAGVDAINQQRLAEVLGGLTEHTVVMVAHGLGPMAPLVTRTIVLDRGQISYDSPTPPPDLLDVHHHSDSRPAAPVIMQGP